MVFSCTLSCSLHIIFVVYATTISYFANLSAIMIAVTVLLVITMYPFKQRFPKFVLVVILSMISYDL